MTYKVRYEYRVHGVRYFDSRKEAQEYTTNDPHDPWDGFGEYLETPYDDDYKVDYNSLKTWITEEDA